MKTTGRLWLSIVVASGCGGGSAIGGSGGSGVGGHASGTGGAGGLGGHATGTGGAGGVGGAGPALTFWQDVAPIYNAKCVPCHQAGGIAPFALDNFATARANAVTARLLTAAGTMPPYFMVHDDSCGSFHDEKTLTAAEKATIAAWVNGGRAEGTPVTLTPPAKPALAGAVAVVAPMFSPVAQGGQLAENDEYRCFPLDPPNTTDAFVTGYDVSPGEASIVHHVIMFVLDPQAVGSGNKTNAALMQTMDNESPDRLGWPCFGGAGDGLKVESVPVTWAPGQGVVTYPDGMGVPLAAKRKLVVQVHYNLVDPASVGLADQTTVHVRLADKVDRKLVFLLPDPFLGSLGNTTPESLPPGKEDAQYTWTRTAQQIGLSGVPSADLVAVMPHMHGRGVRQTMTLGGTCASHLEGWDFHWQEFYFYKTRPTLTPTTQIQVTCEYDTSADTTAILPGWGTRNEMCLNVLMLALPAGM